MSRLICDSHSSPYSLLEAQFSIGRSNTNLVCQPNYPLKTSSSKLICEVSDTGLCVYLTFSTWKTLGLLLGSQGRAPRLSPTPDSSLHVFFFLCLFLSSSFPMFSKQYPAFLFIFRIYFILGYFHAFFLSSHTPLHTKVIFCLDINTCVFKSSSFSKSLDSGATIHVHWSLLI